MIRKLAKTIVALLRLTVKLSPKWARVIAGVCVAIPGPFDELIVWPLLIAYVALRNRAEFAATARDTWSKS